MTVTHERMTGRVGPALLRVAGWFFAAADQVDKIAWKVGRVEHWDQDAWKLKK